MTAIVGRRSSHSFRGQIHGPASHILYSPLLSSSLRELPWSESTTATKIRFEMNQGHFCSRNCYHTLQHQGFSNAAIYASLAKYYASLAKYHSEHQVRAQRTNSLQNSCEPSQFIQLSLSSIPCDNTDSDDKMLGDLFENIMTSQQSICPAPPPPKRDSCVKQLRQNSEHNFCEMDSTCFFDEADFLLDNVDIPSMHGEDTPCVNAANCPQVRSKRLRQNSEHDFCEMDSNCVFDETDFSLDNVGIPSMHGEDTTCVHAADCPQVRSKRLRQNSEHDFCEMDSNCVFDETDCFVDNVGIPIMHEEDTACDHAADCPQVSTVLLHPPTQELSYENTCSHVGTVELATHSDVNANTGTTVGHFPEEQQYTTVTDIPSMTAKRPRSSIPSIEFHTSQEQELAFHQILQIAEALPLTSKKRPCKSILEKRRRDMIKVKYHELYNLSQEIASKTMIMPALRSEYDPKSGQKLNILGDVISLMEKMEKDLTRLRACNKRLKSHHKKFLDIYT